ncbi:MAG: ATP-binding cassette domain-containing protein [Gemmatimonadales bacterium]|nr:ATP-binding cassette domain-containing protein [Gemmatimonadales bacterium]
MIRFTDVSKSFGAKRVLDHFSLEIPTGQTTVLLGYSGTGKSVALKHIVGLLEPDEGIVEVDGQIVPELPRDDLVRLRSSIGYVFQFAALFDSLSVFDNVALGLRQQRRSEADVAARVAASLERVGLADQGDRFPSELSGGMRKRVGIARAIALEPRYILYDEPTTGLDPVTSAVIDELMVRTKRDLGVTGVVVTHDMRSAFAVADRIAMLYQGRVHAVGTVDEIRRTDDPVVRQFIEGRP